MFSWPFFPFYFTITFKIVQWNIRSFRQNKPFILSALSSLTPDVLCLQETWSTPLSPLSLSGFQLAFRYDRPGNPGGGVAVFCANCIPTTPLTISTLLEASAVPVHLHSLTVSLYLHPQLALDSLIFDLSSLLSSLSSPSFNFTDDNVPGALPLQTAVVISWWTGLLKIIWPC